MEDIMNLRYALDTFYFLVMGAFVMWMAAGFAMLEAGLVRAKNTTEILTKNVALYAIACTMYMLVGYNTMYPAKVSKTTPNLLLTTNRRPELSVIHRAFRTNCSVGYRSSCATRYSM